MKGLVKGAPDFSLASPHDMRPNRFHSRKLDQQRRTLRGARVAAQPEARLGEIEDVNVVGRGAFTFQRGREIHGTTA